MHATPHTLPPANDPAEAAVFAAVDAAANWLDEHNGAGPADLGMRLLKVAEELGKAVSAWIGATGQNPRKGRTHTTGDVAHELADVAFTALVAIASIGHDPATQLHATAATVQARITAHPVPVTGGGR
jgi:hypothetical protein